MGFGKDGKGQILYGGAQQQLAALAGLDVDVFGDGYLNALAEDFRVIKMEYWLSWSQQAVGDVVLFGIADGALTAAEIEETLEARPGDSNDVPESEAVMRPVWPLVMLGETATGAGPTIAHGEKTIRWTFKDAAGWTWWAYNVDAGALTSGNQIVVNTKYWGVWVP